MRIRRVVDLSVAVDESTVVYPGDPQPVVTPERSVEADGFNICGVQMGSQSGTHLDAPYHFVDGGARIDEMDLSLFTGFGVVVDATGLAPRTPITWDFFEPVADRLGPGVIVLLHTGWARHYGTDAYFEHPYLDADACRRMLAAGVETILIDAINLDETPDESHPGVGYPCHYLIAEVGGVIGENFRNFDKVTWDNPYISALPLKLTGADGGPTRAAAIEFGV